MFLILIYLAIRFSLISAGIVFVTSSLIRARYLHSFLVYLSVRIESLVTQPRFQVPNNLRVETIAVVILMNKGVGRADSMKQGLAWGLTRRGQESSIKAQNYGLLLLFFIDIGHLKCYTPL